MNTSLIIFLFIAGLTFVLITYILKLNRLITRLGDEVDRYYESVNNLKHCQGDLALELKKLEQKIERKK